MTDRVHTLAVVLKEDVRDDDIESLMEAIRHFRNVADVSFIVTTYDSHMAQVRANLKMRDRLLRLLDETRETDV